MNPTFAAQQAPAELTADDFETLKVDTRPATRGFAAQLMEVVSIECEKAFRIERERIAALEAKAAKLVTTATLNAQLQKALRCTGAVLEKELNPILERLERLEQPAGGDAAATMKGVDCGTWKSTSTYGPPAIVSHAGRRWIATRSTSAEPGSGGPGTTGWAPA